MGFKEELEQALQGVPNEQYREQLRETLAKPECKELAEGWLRQSDYSRQMNDLSETRKGFEGEKSKFEQERQAWKDWYYKTAKPQAAAIEEKNAALKEERDRLKTELETVRSQLDSGDLGDDDEAATKRIEGLYTKMTELEKALSSGNFLTKDQFEEQLQSESAAFADRFADALLDVVEIQQEHQQSYGERLDRSDLFKFMNENDIRNPRKAYEQMTQEKRIDKRVQAEVSERLKAAEEEWKTEHTARSFPGSLPAPPSEMGHIQARFLRERSGSDNEPAPKLGAVAAAEALVAEGKG